MAATLPGFARLVPPGDSEAMAEQFLWIDRNRDAARIQALEGRTMVQRDWSREKSFADLALVLERVAVGAAGGPATARTVAHG